MVSEKLKSIILKELNLLDFDIKDETKAYEMPARDSLNHLTIILPLENYYGIRFKSIDPLKLKNKGVLQNLNDPNTN